MPYRVLQRTTLNGTDYQGGERITDKRAAEFWDVRGLVMAGILAEDQTTPEPEPLPDNLDKMTRAELNELASGLGIEDAESLDTKADVISAIEEQG